MLCSLCVGLVIGCDSPYASAPVVVAEAPSLVDLPLVAHPEYENWSRFAEGTQVVRKDNLASTDGEAILYTTLRLAKKTDAGVTIESQNAIVRKGERQESDPVTAEYAAQFRLPKGMELEQFQLPTLKAKKVREETVKVADQEYNTEVFTFQDQSESGPVDVTLWRSNEFPGRQVKKEIVDKQGVMLSSSTIAEIKISQ